MKRRGTRVVVGVEDGRKLWLVILVIHWVVWRRKK